MESIIVVLCVVAWLIKHAKQAQKTQKANNKIRFKHAIQTVAEQHREESVGAPIPFQNSFPLQENGLSDMFSERHIHREQEYGNNRTSLEGVDTCDPALGHLRELSTWDLSKEESKAREVPEWSLNFTKDALVQNIIMSEILIRPSQRRRGRFNV